jgi:hypothetical protein
LFSLLFCKKFSHSKKNILFVLKANKAKSISYFTIDMLLLPLARHRYFYTDNEQLTHTTALTTRLYTLVLHKLANDVPTELSIDHLDHTSMQHITDSFTFLATHTTSSTHFLNSQHLRNQIRMAAFNLEPTPTQQFEKKKNQLTNELEANNDDNETSYWEKYDIFLAYVTNVRHLASLTCLMHGGHYDKQLVCQLAETALAVYKREEEKIFFEIKNKFQQLELFSDKKLMVEMVSACGLLSEFNVKGLRGDALYRDRIERVVRDMERCGVRLLDCMLTGKSVSVVVSDDGDDDRVLDRVKFSDEKKRKFVASSRFRNYVLDFAVSLVEAGAKLDGLDADSIKLLAEFLAPSPHKHENDSLDHLYSMPNKKEVNILLKDAYFGVP